MDTRTHKRRRPENEGRPGVFELLASLAVCAALFWLVVAECRAEEAREEQRRYERQNGTGE